VLVEGKGLVLSGPNKSMNKAASFSSAARATAQAMLSAPELPTRQLARPAPSAPEGSEAVCLFSAWRTPPDGSACLAESLRHRWKVYHRQLRACRGKFPPPAVHRLRVATRRLMSFYSMLSQVTHSEAAAKAARKLKRRLKTVGKLRDLQVQRIFVEEHLDRFPELGGLLNFLIRQERGLKKAVARKVARCKSRKLRMWTKDFCLALESTPKTAEHQEAISASACSALSAAFAEVATRRDKMSAANPQRIHETRVAFKHFRYLVESLSPAFTGLHPNALRPFGVYQTRLGSVQDLQVLLETVQCYLTEAPEDTPELQGFLQFIERRRKRAIGACLAHADDLYRVCKKPSGKNIF
jgi:CHAD domain-containing protein